MSSQNIKFSLMAIEAKDLMSADSNGYSDPYFKIPHRQAGVVDLPGKKNRSKTIKKTLNPVWNHTFDVEFNPHICTKLNIEVFDYDTFGKDDCIGSAVIPLEWMSVPGQDIYDQWVPLTVVIKDKKTKATSTQQKGSVHVRIQVKSRPANLAQSMPNQPPMGQQPFQPPMGQFSMPPPSNQNSINPMNSQPPMDQPPENGPNPYPSLNEISSSQPPNGPQNQMSQPPSTQPPNQPSMAPPLQQPPIGQPPIGQPPIGQPPQQPPMGQPPQQPPIGQPPIGQPPQQPPMGQPPQQPPIGQPPQQPPIGQPPQQPPYGPPQQQPPYGPPPQQAPHGQPQQPPYGPPPQQPPHGQPQQPPYGPPPQQPPYGPPPQQPPHGQPQQPPYGPPQQPPYGQPPQQPYYPPQPGQPPVQAPYGQPPHGQPLMRPGTLKTQPMFPPMPGQAQPLGRPPTFQQPMVPPAQRSMMPHPPYGLHPAAFFPPHAAQPPIMNSMMPPHMMAQPVNMMPPGIMPHKRGDALQPGSWILIQEPTVIVGLGWDFTGSETFDLDASITGFDYNYNVVESIYFSNKKGLSNSVIHYGDNTTGKGQGDDEVIKCILNKVPQRVHFLAVTINSYKKNSLIRARSAYIRLYTDSYHIGKYVLNRTKDCIGLLLGVFERDPNTHLWYFRVMADPIHGNKVTLSYEDIKTLLGSYSMRTMNTGPRVVHPLPGEPVFEFNKWIQLPNRFTYVGLGWHIQQGLNFDLDASILTFDKMNNLLEIIYHKNMQSYNGSIMHYGDNRTGLGEGDDEVLSVDFGNVDPNTFTMAVVINSFKGNSLVHIINAFIRLYDTQKPLGVHVLNKCPECVGLCLGLFRKNDGGLWYFASIKEIIRGIVCTESVNDVAYLLPKYPLKA